MGYSATACLLGMPGKHGLWTIEIKRGLSPSPGNGFIIARADLKPDIVDRPIDDEGPLRATTPAASSARDASALT